MIPSRKLIKILGILGFFLSMRMPAILHDSKWYHITWKIRRAAIIQEYVDNGIKVSKKNAYISQDMWTVLFERKCNWNIKHENDILRNFMLNVVVIVIFFLVEVLLVLNCNTKLVFLNFGESATTHIIVWKTWNFLISKWLQWKITSMLATDRRELYDFSKEDLNYLCFEAFLCYYLLIIIIFLFSHIFHVEQRLSIHRSNYSKACRLIKKEEISNHWNTNGISFSALSAISSIHPSNRCENWSTCRDYMPRHQIFRGYFPLTCTYCRVITSVFFLQLFSPLYYKF